MFNNTTFDDEPGSHDDRHVRHDGEDGIAIWKPKEWVAESHQQSTHRPTYELVVRGRAAYEATAMAEVVRAHTGAQGHT